MSNDLVTVNNQDYVQLVKDTFCKGADDQQLKLFLEVSRRTGLDPTLKQIYAVFREDRKLQKKVMTIQTGIDGYRLVADKTGMYAPGKEPTFVYDDKGGIVSATAYIKKMTPDGTWHEVSACAHYSEYVQMYDYKPTTFWAKMPHGQLAKCAEALAIRKAFPNHFSQLYVKEEMDQASNRENTEFTCELTDEQKLQQIEIQKIFEEFPDLKENVMKAVNDGKKDVLDFYTRIVKSANMRREQQHKQEILMEYAQ